MILKVQRPLFPPNGPWLMYNKDRSIFHEVEPSKKEIEAMGDDLKMYAEYGSVNSRLAILGRVGDQGW